MVEISENHKNMTYRVCITRKDDAKEYEFYAEDLNEIAEIVLSDRIRAMEAEIYELRHRLDIATRACDPALREAERKALKLMCKLYAEN